jgi:hypothetical protein
MLLLHPPTLEVSTFLAIPHNLDLGIFIPLLKVRLNTSPNPNNCFSNAAPQPLLSLSMSLSSTKSAAIMVSKASFMGLPLEIREIVYDELWNSSPDIRITGRELQTGVPELRITYGNAESPDWTRDSLPDWLFTSKAILHEGLT